VTALTESAAPPRASPSSFVEGDALLERERDVHRFLPRHGVQDEEDVGRLRRVAHALELVHQLLVHVQAAGGVEDDHIEPGGAGGIHAESGRSDGVVGIRRVHGDLDLPSELLELVDRRRALQVARDERGPLALAPEHERQLGGGRRLARALQAREQDHRGRLAEREPGVAGPHQRGQLLVDDLDHLLTGRQAPEHVLAEGSLLHGGGEVLRDLEVHVGLEQRETDLAHRLRDRFLVEPATPAEAAEGALDPV
jgi:hypothetical protein